MSDMVNLKRGELRVAPRSPRRTGDFYQAGNSQIIEKKPEVTADSKSLQIPSSALPTIPIMTYVDGEPTNISKIVGPLSNEHKYLDPIIAKKSNNIDSIDNAIWKRNNIEVVPVKAEAKPELPTDILFESEPATTPIDNKDKKYKEKKNKKTKKKNDIKIVKAKVKKSKSPILRQIPVLALIFTILGATGYVSYSTWQTNSQIRANLKSNNKDSSVLGADTKSSKEDQKNNLGANNFFGDYSVAANLPRVIYIDKINVIAKILPMSLNSDSTLQSPGDANDTGWYVDSAKPGKDGAVLLDGHTSATTSIRAIFDRLGEIAKDDNIVVERGDGKKFVYKVVHSETVPLSEVDMSKMLKPYGGAKQGLNLITCTGAWISEKQTLDHRLMVYAVLKE